MKDEGLHLETSLIFSVSFSLELRFGDCAMWTSDATMLLVVLALAVGFVVASPIQSTPFPDLDDDYLDSVEPRPVVDGSLIGIMQEVEKLMKDTDAKLKNAVKELDAEKFSEDKFSLEDLPPNYHNETVKETKVGNATIVTREEIIKECIVDEDCRAGNYCHLSSVNYRCLPCKEEETCARDGECCEGRLCVWGQCRKSLKGQSGTICESPQDCGPGLCCAMHASLLFPVCTPLPGKGEQCQNLNPLLDLFAWELESDAPANLCPCPRGLVCQPESHSLVSVCEDPSVLKRNNPDLVDEDLSLFTPAPQEGIIYEDSLVVPTGFEHDLSASEDVIDKEPELAPQTHFTDYI
ncbi:dickkopf-related protein 3 isoform X2 [Ranitomeya imitator]|uniref:dickkopf-related protein 3 isoform X2 n=2 Tax=Ranitomeya imitator TaxID=111125 RepID=UPI0037E9C713